jgi:3-oxoacyl-[acyl-carrier-protein] synthase-3
MVIARDYGNTIAASIPLALHEAVQQGRIERGDKVMLLGTSAGFSMGALLLQY